MCKGKYPPKDIKLLNFKAKDWKPKLEDLNSLGFTPYFDASILRETWKADPSKINIEAYWITLKFSQNTKMQLHTPEKSEYLLNKTWTETE